MKTNINKIPLVGPRGRREILDKINELEKKIKELENKEVDALPYIAKLKEQKKGTIV